MFKLAEILGHSDAPFETMLITHGGGTPTIAPYYTNPLTCALCMFPATRSLGGFYWCENHCQTAKKVARSTGIGANLLRTVQRFLWKMQLECAECEDTNRCSSCAECECKECDHWCPDCNEFVRGFLVCGDCGVRSCSSC